MANNKVIYGNQIIMDITDTTAEPSDVLDGEVFYDRAGVRQVGTVITTPVDTAMSDSSTNAVQNRVIKAYVDANAGDENIIETIQRNGTALPVNNKTVNVQTPTIATQSSANAHDIKVSDSTGNVRLTVGAYTSAVDDRKVYVDLKNGSTFNLSKTLGTIEYIDAGDQALQDQIDNLSGAFVAEYNVTPVADVVEAINAEKPIIVKHGTELFIAADYSATSSSADLYVLSLPSNINRYAVNSNGWAFTSTSLVKRTDTATDSDYGVVKTNSAQSITLNASGQLEVGGRLGQFPNGGVYYPTDRNFARVGNYSFAISDAQNMFMGNREMVIAGGLNLTLRSSHAAGSTVYQVSNSYQNRIALSNMVGGVATRQESTAGTFTVPIASIKFANGNDISPYSGATESNNNIVITTDGSANPDDATTQIRLYGKFSGTDIISAGQGNASSGGKCMQVGQSCQNAGSSQVIQIGNSVYSSGNNSAQFGRQHINKQTDSLLAGYGHDNTNGSQGASALGLWSSIDANTAFAVGNGTAVTARSNAFEVTKDGGIVLKSPNGTRYKITVDDTGALTATAV